jgi:hypothetical protein
MQSISSVIPNITQSIEVKEIVFVKQELTVNWASGQNEIIDAWKNKLAEYMIPDYGSTDITGTDMIDGYIKAIFVSPDGELPGYLGRGEAIAAGILHCYTVDALPMATVKVVKNEASVGEEPLYNQWPGVTCWRRSKSERKQ